MDVISFAYNIVPICFSMQFAMCEILVQCILSVVGGLCVEGC